MGRKASLFRSCFGCVSNVKFEPESHEVVKHTVGVQTSVKGGEQCAMDDKESIVSEFIKSEEKNAGPSGSCTEDNTAKSSASIHSDAEGEVSIPTTKQTEEKAPSPKKQRIRNTNSDVTPDHAVETDQPESGHSRKAAISCHPVLMGEWNLASSIDSDEEIGGEMNPSDEEA